MTTRLIAVIAAGALLGAGLAHAIVAGNTPPPSHTITPLPSNGTADTSWSSYNLNLRSDRYSNIADLNASNVGQLKELCRVKVEPAGSFQSGLLLVDGILYASARSGTIAIDPTDCTVLWKSLYVPEQKEPYTSNRGPAIADGRLFRGTTDCHLLALNAKTGAPLWNVKPCDPEAGEWLAAAPIVWDNKVYIGIAGGEWGVQGRMFAFDVATGKQLWRFNTVPTPGEPGSETWKGDSWKTGGGGLWTSYTLDADTHELFLSVGNPGSDFDSSVRPGANLYTNSLVVLDATTGALKWWYQISPHDDKDVDVAAAPMLLSLRDGRGVVALGSKDGHLYLIDRQTHKILHKTAITTITNQDQPVTDNGMVVCPGILGGVEWNGPAYDRLHHAVVVGAVDWCSVLTRKADPNHVRGEVYLGGTWTLVTDPAASGWVTSVDPETGRARWAFHADAPVVSGITPTAGGLIFAGDMGGHLYALDSNDGTVRFKQQTGGAIAGGIITYRIAQHQYVATTSGNISRFVWGEAGLPHIVIYGLGNPVVKETASAETKPVALTGDATRGSAVYNRLCVSCHGASGEGISGPALKNIASRQTVDAIATIIRTAGKRPELPSGGAMPSLYPGILNDQEVMDVATYVHSQ